MWFHALNCTCPINYIWNWVFNFEPHNHDKHSNISTDSEAVEKKLSNQHDNLHFSSFPWHSITLWLKEKLWSYLSFSKPKACSILCIHHRGQRISCVNTFQLPMQFVMYFLAYLIAKILKLKYHFDKIILTGKDPCGMCVKGVGTNSIVCGGCSIWVQRICSGILGPLKPDDSFRCKWCRGQTRPVDGRPMTEITVGREKFEVVSSFCYLGDCLSSGGRCELPSITKTHFHHKIQGCIGQIQWSPVCPHLPLISYHLQRNSLEFVCQECHAPCKTNLGPNLIWLASLAMHWLSYDPLDVLCHHQGTAHKIPGGHLNIKMPSYQYMHTWERRSLYWDRALERMQCDNLAPTNSDGTAM